MKKSKKGPFLQNTVYIIDNIFIFVIAPVVSFRHVILRYYNKWFVFFGRHISDIYVKKTVQLIYSVSLTSWL